MDISIYSMKLSYNLWNYLCNLTNYLPNTAVGLKSDRNGFTKMRVTASIIVRLLRFFKNKVTNT